MRIVFVNRYYHPDHSATSQILSELSFDLVREGYEVHVVASRQRYDDPSAALTPRECVHGVQVHRVWTSRFGRNNLAGRAFDYLTFYVTAGLALVQILHRNDVVVAKTDPPLISVVAAIAARLRSAVLVNWLQDVFPEVGEQLGVRLLQGFAGRLARSLRDYSLRSASTSVVLGDRMAGTVSSRGAGLRVEVIHNWADGGAIVPMQPAASELRREWGLENRFVVAYSGNLGRAHEFETIVGAMERLDVEPDVLFLFIGGGNKEPWLRSQLNRRGLAQRAVFEPYQPKEKLSHSLCAAEAHLVTLQRNLEGLIVPSKFYGIAAAGRPAIFVGDPQGEIATLIRRHECGISIATGDCEGLASAIRLLKYNEELRQRMGTNARAALLKHYDRPLAVKRWRRVLEEIAG